MKIRSVVAGLAIAGSTLLVASPAYAHNCSLNASPPTAGGNTVTGRATYTCTSGHTSAKLWVQTCLDWQDSNGQLNYVCEVGWTWVVNQTKTQAVNVGCPLVPTTYSTWSEAWMEHTDTGAIDHIHTDSTPGVLVDPVTCAVLPRII